MKRLSYIAFLLLIAVLFVACGQKPEDPTTMMEGTSQTIPVESAMLQETEAEFGILQEVVDSYGFPFYFENTEGMEKTEIRLFESYAQRHWTSNNQQTLHENLVWNLIGNTLQVSGQWEESFLIDMTTGKATSLTDGKVYRLVVYDENGDGHGYVE